MHTKDGHLIPPQISSHKGPIPRHLLEPGEEGYRTPTIEDFEQDDGNEKRASPFPPAPTQPLPTDIHQELYRIASSHEPPSVEKRRQALASANGLSWRYRVKHFTWAYFTLSMATGGICNVLWTGKEPYILASHQPIVCSTISIQRPDSHRRNLLLCQYHFLLCDMHSD